MLAPGLVVAASSILAEFIGFGGAPGFGRGQSLALAVGAAFMVAGLLLHRKALKEFQSCARPYFKTVAFVLLPMSIALVGTTILMDRAIGILYPASKRQGLLFPPNTSVAIKTPEFTYTVETNSLGVRDREFTLAKQAATRIVALGDSFTYGWGVDIENSWPKELERLLQAAGHDAEVLNLGCPGASVDQYADVAEKVLPLLKPDVVLVGVLQGDDLASLTFTEAAGAAKTGRSVEVWNLARSCLPNLTRICVDRAPIGRSHVSANEMTREWQGQARLICERLNGEARRRYEKMAPRAREMFLAGELNPNLVQNALLRPGSLELTLKTNSPPYADAVASMGHHVARIKRAASGARPLVLSAPYAAYVSKRSLNCLRGMGFELDDECLRSNAPDDAIRSAAELAGVECASVTDRFRAAPDELFFAYDGHFTRAGQSLFAKSVLPAVVKCVVGSR